MGDPFDEQLPPWAVACLIALLIWGGLALAYYVLTLTRAAHP